MHGQAFFFALTLIATFITMYLIELLSSIAICLLQVKRLKPLGSVDLSVALSACVKWESRGMLSYSAFSIKCVG